MRIKKYQKIICLGLALLSIMVLPCYADFSLRINKDILIYGSGDYEIFPNVNNIQVDGYDFITGLYVYDESGNTISIIKSNNEPIVLLYYLLDNEITENNPPTLLSGKIKPYKIDYVTLNFGEQSLDLYELRYKINSNDYRVEVDNGKNVYLINIQLYNQLFGQYIARNGERFYLYIYDNVSTVVFNITTFTNLLIQNFGKAFTFMTGPALAWVLLGISVSLISFGVYSAKRFL